MSVYIKNLGLGLLTTASSTTIGPGAAKAWIVKGIVLTNRDAVARGITVQVTNGAGSPTTALIAPTAMSIPPSTTVVLDTEITLRNPEGLILTLPVAATTGVDYVINGLERDV